MPITFSRRIVLFVKLLPSLAAQAGRRKSHTLFFPPIRSLRFLLVTPSYAPSLLPYKSWGPDAAESRTAAALPPPASYKDFSQSQPASPQPAAVPYPYSLSPLIQRTQGGGRNEVLAERPPALGEKLALICVSSLHLDSFMEPQPSDRVRLCASTGGLRIE